MAGGTSYNGWPCSDSKEAINVQDFGDQYGLPFPGGVRGGDVATVLGYVASQIHFRVEECIAGYDWGYSYRENVNSPGSMSCHASATAIDYNAPLHGNGAYGTWTDSQKGEIYAILNEVQGAVQWGEDYTGTIDGMHFEIIVGADTLAAVAATLGGNTPPPPQNGDWFEMASMDDLKAVVDERLEFYLPRLLNVLFNGQENAAFSPGNNDNLMLGSGGIAGQVNAAVLDEIKDLPMNVWLKTITSQNAADLLAKAANG